MKGWECVVALLVGWALFMLFTVWYIRSDNKPAPRKPWDP